MFPTNLQAIGFQFRSNKMHDLLIRFGIATPDTVFHWLAVILAIDVIAACALCFLLFKMVGWMVRR